MSSLLHTLIGLTLMSATVALIFLGMSLGHLLNAVDNLYLMMKAHHDANIAAEAQKLLAQMAHPEETLGSAATTEE